MLMTSNEANKLIRTLKSKILDIETLERQTRTFVVAVGEDIEDERPKYSFSDSTREIIYLNEKIRKIKHSINLFNANTKLKTVDITIDEALVYLPQLNQEANKLKEMKAILPKSKIRNYSSPIIQYEIANFDSEDVKGRADAVDALITTIQTELDELNNSIKFEVDID